MENFKQNTICLRIGFDNIQELQDAFNKALSLTRQGIVDYTEDDLHQLNFTADHNLIDVKHMAREEIIDGRRCLVLKSKMCEDD